MDLALLIVRLGLAAVFAVAAFGKLSDLKTTRRTLREFGVPERLTPVGAVALPGAELVTVGLLIANPTAPWGGVLALVLLAIFIAGISRSLARGEQPDCNCFGGVHSAPVGPLTLVRNLVFAAAAALVVAAGPGESLGALDGGTVVAVAGAIGGALLLGLVCFSWQLFKQNGRLLARVRTLEEIVGVAYPAVVAPRTGGLGVGEVAPELVLATPDGGRRLVQGMLRPGRTLAVVFSSPGCAGCDSLAGKLPGLRAELDGAVDFAIVSGGPGPHTAMREGFAVFVQERHEGLEAFALGAVPSAVILDHQGRVATSSAIGEDAVVDLLRSSIGPPDLEVVEATGVRP